MCNKLHFPQWDISFLFAPHKRGSPNLILATEYWCDNTEGQSLFFPRQQPLLPLGWRWWKAHTDTLTQLAGFCQSSRRNQPRLFMLLLFIRLHTKQSLHFQHCQRETLTVQPYHLAVTLSIPLLSTFYCLNPSSLLPFCLSVGLYLF